MTTRSCLLLAALSTVAFPMNSDAAERSRKTVIAHRGASGYLPEHTLEAKAMAHAMGADFIEQDVVLTKDDVPVVLHDIHLDTVTDVAKVFPDRAREDGRFYAIDFALAEVKRLRVYERIDLKTGKAVFPKRFPVGRGRFEVPTLAEEIELIQGLNKSTGGDVGIYPEIKSPAHHRREGKDISRIVIKLLEEYGYHDRDDNIYLQCFDADETKRIRLELKSKLKLVQLIGKNSWNEAPTDFDALRTPDGIRSIAEYADGIGPSLDHIVPGHQTGEALKITNLVELAHKNGLTVHPYTFRADALPDYADSFEELLDVFLTKAGVDGVFTDFPDRALAVIRNREK
jgi:glycerophosphoryl diester phosphodiesterase